MSYEIEFDIAEVLDEYIIVNEREDGLIVYLDYDKLHSDVDGEEHDLAFQEKVEEYFHSFIQGDDWYSKSVAKALGLRGATVYQSPNKGYYDPNVITVLLTTEGRKYGFTWYTANHEHVEPYYEENDSEGYLFQPVRASSIPTYVFED